MERTRRLATRMVKGMRELPYEDRHRRPNISSPERRRLRGDLVLAYNISHGRLDLPQAEFFEAPPERDLRGHGYKLRHRSFRLYMVLRCPTLPLYLTNTFDLMIWLSCKERQFREWLRIFTWSSLDASLHSSVTNSVIRKGLLVQISLITRAPTIRKEHNSQTSTRNNRERISQFYDLYYITQQTWPILIIPKDQLTWPVLKYFSWE